MHCNDEDKRAIGAESSSEFDGVTLQCTGGWVWGKEEVGLNFGEIGRGVVN